MYEEFTFQYGQIYYAGIRDDEFLSAHIYIPIWLDLLCKREKDLLYYDKDLHSNMVRFIMIDTLLRIAASKLFTFQYGQIYYNFLINFITILTIIYIPIWLDLLFK